MPTVIPTAYIRKFRAVADVPLRRRLIADTLGEADASSIGRFVTYLLDRMDEEGVRPLYLDTLLFFFSSDTLERETRLEAYARLNEGPFGPICLFMSGAGNPVPPAISREYPYEMEDIAPGIRKARARSRDRNTIQVISADPNPDVIRILLENPMSTEVDALKVASLRPQSRDTFEVIISNVRFGVREMIQAAVVQNPFSPIRLAAGLVPLLSRNHQEQVVTSPSLDSRVRDAASACRSGLP